MRSKADGAALRRSPTYRSPACESGGADWFGVVVINVSGVGTRLINEPDRAWAV